MGSRQHHCPVANNITKKAEKGQGMKPCPPHVLAHFLTINFFFNFIIAVRSAQFGDISTPRMNGKLATRLPCRQQHYQEGGKRSKYKTMPSTCSSPVSH
jgi:hypothetical protein